MARNRLEITIANLGPELNSIESRARMVSANLGNHLKEIECNKVEFLQHCLEERIKSEARGREVSLITREKKNLGNSLLIAVGSYILGGLVSKDNLTALNMGMSGFDGTLQGFGQARWYVSSGEKILVTSGNASPSQEKWFTWESLKWKMVQLKERARHGENLGSPDSIITKLEGKLKYQAQVIKLNLRT